MDGREAMAMSSGRPQYFTHKGGISGGGGSGSGHHSEFNSSAPVFRALANSHHLQASQSSIHTTLAGQGFAVSPQPQINFSHGISIETDSMAPKSESVRKKRGRPRKYGPDGNGKMALGLLPMSNTQSGSPLCSSLATPLPKRTRGRPPGSGRKQRLASVGEWMNDSAGVAFAPHVIKIRSGEDIAAKILSFSQQRPRAMCILSGSGMVSLVTLKHSSSSGSNITYEGRFEILCLSGSYLLAEEGGPRNRTGGISVSLSSPDGHLIGGSVAMLIASGPVQVVVCSFVYGLSPKPKEEKVKQIDAAPEADEEDTKPPHSGGSKPFATPAPRHYTSSSSVAAMWPSSQPLDLKHLHTDIDLMRG